MRLLDLFKRKRRPVEDIEVEPGIEIPPLRGGSVPRYDALLLGLKIGDSFEVDDVREVSTVRCAAKRLHMKIASRQAKGGRVRVWRIAVDQRNAQNNEGGK